MFIAFTCLAWFSAVLSVNYRSSYWINKYLKRKRAKYNFCKVMIISKTTDKHIENENRGVSLITRV